MSKPRLIVVTGPTASGKSACGVELCLRNGGEVVSADSMQIYRRMDVGTAKPTPSEMRGVKHHMLSVVEPETSFSASAYGEMALPVVRGLLGKRVEPVVCGGTGLYIDALTRAQSFAQYADGALRDELRALLSEENGKARLHEMLTQCDPESAARLHPNDTRRVIRAIEVYRVSGRTIGEQARLDALRESEFDARLFALEWPRDALYARIDARVREMMESGLVREVEALLDSGLSEDATSMQAIGYKEIACSLHGEYSIARAAELIAQRTRNYAKRQMTWLRRDERTRWIPASGQSSSEIAEQIAEEAQK